jgi:hypothetical protein
MPAGTYKYTSHPMLCNVCATCISSEKLLAQVCPTQVKREVPYTIYDALTNLADRRTSCGQSFQNTVTHSLYTMVKIVHNVFVTVRSFLQQASLYLRSKVSLQVSRRVRPAKMLSLQTFHSAHLISFSSWYDRLSLKRSSFVVVFFSKRSLAFTHPPSFPRSDAITCTASSRRIFGNRFKTALYAL